MKRLPILAIAILSMFAVGCQSEPEPENTKPTTATWTHEIIVPTATWYKGGPQQSSPPDGQIPKGTRVKLISEAGSYSEISAETGEKGFVASNEIGVIKPNP